MYTLVYTINSMCSRPNNKGGFTIRLQKGVFRLTNACLLRLYVVPL